MSRSADSPATYEDVKKVMSIAIERPGVQYELETSGRAINFKQRCYKYRNLLRKQLQDANAHIPGFVAETAFDILVISQIDETGEPNRKNGRILQFNHAAATGILRDPTTGEEIDLGVKTGRI